MNQRIMIPDTDLSLCPVGLGTAAAGAQWSGKEADAIFDTYIDMGGNLIDTARVYQEWMPGGEGRSESVVGEWSSREKKRNSFILMTKGGHPRFRGPQDDLHIPRMTPADMREDLELSLKALRTDVIDIYFYHRDNRNQTIEEEIETMEQFRKEGKIRYYGCSNWSAQRMEEADEYCREHGYRGFVADQVLFNMGVQHMNPPQDDTLECMEGAVLEYHRKNLRCLAVAYTSIAGGFFQKYLSGADITGSPYYTEGNIRLAGRIQKLAEKYGATISQVLIGYLMTGEFPCAALYGPKNAAQIREAMDTLDIPFERADYEAEIM